MLNLFLTRYKENVKNITSIEKAERYILDRIGE